MKFKILICCGLYFVYISCAGKKEIIPSYYKVLHKKVKIISIDKKRKYYNIKGIDEVGDTLVLVSKNEKVLSRTGTNIRELVKLDIDFFYNLDVLELNPIGRAGEFGRVAIVVYKDTLWQGVVRDTKAYKNKYFRILDVYYEDINNK